MSVAAEPGRDPSTDWAVQLRNFRRAREMKQVVLAKIAGVDQATVSRWERGHSIPDRRTQRRLCDLMRRAPNEETLLKHWFRMATGQIALVNQAKVLRAASPGYSSAHGVSLEEIVGRSIAPMFSEESEALWETTRQHGFYRGDLASVTVVARANSLSGHLRNIPVKVVWMPFRLADGEVLLRTDRVVLTDAELELSVAENGGPIRMVTVDELMRA